MMMQLKMVFFNRYDNNHGKESNKVTNASNRRFSFRECNAYHLFTLLVGISTLSTVYGGDEIAGHIRKCCISGIQHAGTQNNCEKYDHEVNAIPPLWRGLCHSTYGVCCSLKLAEQYCVAGRLAALRGSRCDEQYNTSAYADCCRACQVGLAVKASNNNCGDALFSYFDNIETYHICCGDAKVTPLKNSDSGGGGAGEGIGDGSSDGTIVLRDGDICSKVSRLCQQICENTKESYRCKCRPGYKLNDDYVTCAPIGTSMLDGGSVRKETINDKHDNVMDEEEIKEDPHIGIAELDDDEDIVADTNEASTAGTSVSGDGAGGDSDIPLKCVSGYAYNIMQQKCIDIDECAVKIDNCKSSQYCHNTIGSYRCLRVKAKFCEAGFQFNAELEKCEEKYNTHFGSRTSSNSDHISLGGSTTQMCLPGFQRKYGRCVDIDECALDVSACDSNQVCTNDVGGYHCDCKIGFNLDTTTNACVDINECSINNHNCLSTQRCDNTLGSYICTRLQSCGTGYTLNAETNNCDDDNECMLNTHNCPSDYECYNTKGSFRCYRKPTPTTSATTAATSRTTTTTTTLPPPITTTTNANRLPYYYSRNNGTSDTGSDGFPYPGASYASHLTYSQTYSRERSPHYVLGGVVQNSFNDAALLPPCGVGFHRNHLGACVDINECDLANPCGSHQRCINMNGSYRCQNLLHCLAGYKSTPDGTQCLDIDECETGEHQCAENQLCRNRQGGYICSCPPGHQLSRLSNGVSRCVDFNECEQQHPTVCPSNAQCLNTIGSYYCECKSGFQKNKENERICLDVDECQEIPGLCQQKCVNFWGGYRCTCNQGFELSVDNRTCNDVDECDVHKSYKLCMGFCNNIPGKYECSCPRGYTLAMDKTTCKDIDECATGDFCTGRNDICTNIRGSYKCTTIHCQYGYVNDPDQKNRCRLTSNLCEGDECYNKPSAYTYNFITLISKLMIPPEGRIIFSLRGPLWYDDIDFDLKIIKIQAAANIEKASDNHFDTIKGKHEVHLQLKRSLEGPQDIELELSMTVFTNGMPRGKSVAKIFILVSQYTF